MVAREWIGSLAVVAVVACTPETGGLGTHGSSAGSSDSSGTSSGPPPSDDATSTGAGTVSGTGTSTTTPGETVELDSTTGDATTSDATTGEPTCDATPPWWDAAWARRRALTVDAAAVTEALVEVPIRVRLDASRIDYAAVVDGGADLRFIAEDGATELAYEVERWDESGDSEIWLRAPLVPAGGAPTVWMYYGNPAAPAGANPTEVWDSSFVSVHHLADLADATGNPHDGEGAGLPADAAGRIGRGRFFDGQDDAIVLPQEADFDFDVELTVEAWIQVSSFTVAWQAIVAKGDDAWRLHRQLTSSFIGFGSDTATTNDNLSGVTPVDDGAWHHVAIVYGAGTKQIFVDGLLDVSQGYPGPLRTTDAAVVFGTNLETEPRFFHGTLDEVRISRVARSAAWLELQARASADAGVVSFGEEQSCS